MIGNSRDLAEWRRKQALKPAAEREEDEKSLLKVVEDMKADGLIVRMIKE